MQRPRALHVLHVPSTSALLANDKIRLSKPEQVSGYSLHPDGRLTFDRACLKELRPAKIGANLLDGFESHHVEPSEDASPSLQPILDAMLPANREAHHADAHLSPPRLPAAIDVVTFRNNLNKILGTPYNSNSPYVFHVQRRGRTLFLNIQHERDADGVMHPAQAKGAYAGRQYEAIASHGPRGEYCGVFAMLLGSTQLLVGAELDGVDGRGDYVELKTYKLLQTSKDRFSFERYKCLAFWIQSYLVGVGRIRCGFRSADCKLVKEQTFATSQLPAFGAKYWQPNVCLSFAKLVFAWLEDKVPDDTAYEVRYDPRARALSLLALPDAKSFLPTSVGASWPNGPTTS
ncbi:hypothetical protein SPRG_03348, partial [Saprolegnia parasitica CBS 223.65]